MRLQVQAEVTVDAPAAVVWDYVTDWARQGEWVPLTRVEVLTGTGPDTARQVGARFRAWTGLGPLGFWDHITVTGWEEDAGGGGRCEILHTGSVVRGEAELLVRPTGAGRCTARLWERLDVPGGPVGRLLWRVFGRLLGPGLERGAERVLRRMGRQATRPEGGR